MSISNANREDLQLGNISQETADFNENLRPLTKFPDGLDILDSTFNFVPNLLFSTSWSYAGKNSSHKEYLYCYHNQVTDAPEFQPVIPSNKYFKELMESFEGTVTIKDSITSYMPTETWSYDEDGSPKFYMSPKAELEFQKLFREVNKVSEADFKLYSPNWLIKAMNQACSKELQCLAWSDTKGNRELQRQKEDFMSSILRVWNAGLLGYYGNSHGKRVVQRIENVPNTSRFVPNF